MNRYYNDPRWITARYATTCRCGRAIAKQDKALYYPNGKTLLCQPCGEKAYAEFAQAVADETFMAGGYQ